MKVRKQQGLTIIGFILVLSLVIFFSYIGMRIWPIYYNHFAVVNAMNSVAEQRGAANMSLRDIRIRVYSNLFVSGTEGFIKEKDITKVRDNGTYLRVAYEVRKPLIANLDVVATFDRRVPLQN
jgi:hypothetical protein